MSEENQVSSCCMKYQFNPEVFDSNSRSKSKVLSTKQFQVSSEKSLLVIFRSLRSSLSQVQVESNNSTARSSFKSLRSSPGQKFGQI